MQSASKYIKVMVLPVYKRTWLWHAWQSTPQAAEAEVAPVLDWREGKTLHEKLSLAWRNTGAKFDSAVKHQWRELQAAKQGSFRSYAYKFALFVLSREDHEESFLKCLPADTTHIDVIYPSGLDVALVRRRLRLLAHQHASKHRNRRLAWGLATLPQLPLLLTPLPNVTVYYSAYRLLSHVQAMQGANVLKAAFARSDALQLQEMYRLYEAARAANVPDSDARGLRERLRELRARFTLRALARKREKNRRLLEKQEASGNMPLLVFEPSDMLDSLTRPLERRNIPLGDDTVQTLSQHYKLNDLVEHFVRARKRAVGS